MSAPSQSLGSFSQTESGPSLSPPTGSPNGGSSDGNSSANATLYLYTFLATLVLLLAVSSAIVIRSLVLRRRHQRLVEEAIRTGAWLPHHFNSTARRRRDIGQKPILWEAWLDPTSDAESEENEKSHWGDIMPVYAAYVNPPAPLPQGSTASSIEPSAVLPSRPPRFVRSFTKKRSLPSQQATAVLPTPSQTPSLSSSSPTVAPTPSIRVAVLVAMPHPSEKHYNDESGPPVVEIGVVEVDMKDDEIEPPSSDSS